MRAAAIFGISIIALVSVGAGTAHAADARNPFHCGVALSVAYDLAKAEHGPDSPLTRELKDRYVWQAMRSAMLPHMTPSEAEADALRARFGADTAIGLAMAKNCVKRQDANPRYLATRPTVPLPNGMQGVLPSFADAAALGGLFAAVQVAAVDAQ